MLCPKHQIYCRQTRSRPDIYSIRRKGKKHLIDHFTDFISRKALGITSEDGVLVLQNKPITVRSISKAN